MTKDYFKELYEAKKELLRCYEWMLALAEKMEQFPIDEIRKSKYDIEKDIEAMAVDIEETK
jgi:hypothetical protein